MKYPKKGKTKKRSSKDKNKKEREWHSRVREIGCILAETGECGGALELDHVTSGGRRISQYHVIPLCRWHHHWDSPLPIGQAYHKGSKPWERNHGKRIDHVHNIFELLGDPRDD